MFYLLHQVGKGERECKKILTAEVGVWLEVVTVEQGRGGGGTLTAKEYDFVREPVTSEFLRNPVKFNSAMLIPGTYRTGHFDE